MLKGGFFKGLLTGGIMGMMANMFLRPERKPLQSKMKEEVDTWEDDAKGMVDEMVDGVKDGISGLWKK